MLYFCWNYNYNDENAVNFKSIFETKFSNYIGDKCELVFDIATVDNIIMNLKRGKASGVNNLSCERLQYAHPLVFSCITVLFNLMSERE